MIFPRYHAWEVSTSAFIHPARRARQALFDSAQRWLGQVHPSHGAAHQLGFAVRTMPASALFNVGHS